MNELQELKQLILSLDEMVGNWFNGVKPEYVLDDDDEYSIYEVADFCRNRALEIIKKLEEENKK